MGVGYVKTSFLDPSSCSHCSPTSAAGTVHLCPAMLFIYNPCHPCYTEQFHSSCRTPHMEQCQRTGYYLKTTIYIGNNKAGMRLVQVQVCKYVEGYHIMSFVIDRRKSECRRVFIPARSRKWRQSTRWRGSRRWNIRQVCHALPALVKAQRPVGRISRGDALG
jgi:hypothetical protein